jgi:DNA-binding IclR family transcriptional regulator
MNRVLALLDERQRRLLAGLLAERRGHGGVVAVARITGLSRTTIHRGLVELRRGDDVPEGRARRPGGGRLPAEKKIPLW